MSLDNPVIVLIKVISDHGYCSVSWSFCWSLEGVVRFSSSTKAREVLVEDEEELDELLHGDDSEETEPDAENLS